jgi:DNA (cytosine-5)-methyltransferase 1
VADAAQERRPQERAQPTEDGQGPRPEQAGELPPRATGCGTDGRLADSNEGRRRTRGAERAGQRGQPAPERAGGNGWLADAEHSKRRPLDVNREDGPNGAHGGREEAHGQSRARSQVCDSFWDAFDLIPCADGKSRRVEPGTFPLAHGVPDRVGLLRGYGNAINPWVAAKFIRAHVESRAVLEA